MQHYSSQVFTDLGKPAGGATITVKLPGTNTNATIYSDDGVTVKSNPFVANNLGQFDFYAASGKYDITVTGTQITTYTLPNQVIFDPFESSAADTALPFAVPLNSVGVGGFWPVTINAPLTNIVGGAVAANNAVHAAQFVLPFGVTVGKVIVSVNTGSAATTGDVGIYSSAGSKIFNTGGFSTASSGVQILNVPSTFLPAGIYYYAWANSSTAVLMQCFTRDTNLETIRNAAAVISGQTTNNAAAGVLPATLGIITNVSVVHPACLMMR